MLHRAGSILGACFFVIVSATVLAACGPLAGKDDKPADTEVVAIEFEGDQPGECSDAADNDRDGKFDCDDEDCKGAPDCAGPATSTSPRAALAATNEPLVVDFTNSASVVTFVFDAIRREDYASLTGLCDPTGEGDGDTKRLCQIGVKPFPVPAEHKADPESFVKAMQDQYKVAFRDGRVTGPTTFSDWEGVSIAHVPIAIGPGGETEEEMQLVRRGDNWFLFQFRGVFKGARADEACFDSRDNANSIVSPAQRVMEGSHV